MSVSLRIDPVKAWQQRYKKRSLFAEIRQVRVMVLISMLIAPVANADIPVVDAYSSETSMPAPSSAAPADTGTAYLFKTIDQLRTEIMSLRGQLEDQAHQINLLQQESRDRYLDLDKRVSQLSNAPSGQIAIASSAPVALAQNKEDAERQAYKAAFQLIQDKRFDQAKKALEQQLVDFPKGNYSANAQYWLGEVNMAQGQYIAAQKAFLDVLNNYPNSAKVPDATYKLGRLADLQGDQQQARQYLESVIKKYPESAASRLSDSYLQKLVDS
ncbi:MAG: tol-pal system protein YbgF [Endozoicomonas sp. (ex Botrylloides leachii)]|nr:tol-pal system protein YbgF [Endozoicomonas sp. (ex Botrylloides leachii)]